MTLDRNGQFVYVCDQEWNLKAAQVACRQLGFKFGLVVTNGSMFNTGRDEDDDSYEMSMNKVHCNGSESSLAECQHETNFGCKQKNFGGLVCSG